ncbi:unnamed protein product [Oikopleura dioica]|uniref:DPF1-3 N-terminal domain-containing protein n=1 Tax=Oikopleura dioica TaxID=34765 RepID=E4XBP3_OIKDI|nr:unnamed protein product [Oikopleura dioica]CBY39022.1 unnamed protein product [Oikopleura dioica]
MVTEAGKVVNSRNWDNIRYKDALESCRIYNNRMLRERNARRRNAERESEVSMIAQVKRCAHHRQPAQKNTQVFSYPSTKFRCKSRPSLETMCPSDPPDRPNTPDNTALDEILARHLANNPNSDESDDEEYGTKRKKKINTRTTRRRKTTAYT